MRFETLTPGGNAFVKRFIRRQLGHSPYGPSMHIVTTFDLPEATIDILHHYNPLVAIALFALYKYHEHEGNRWTSYMNE